MARMSFVCTQPPVFKGRTVRCWKCDGCRTLRTWVKSLRVHLEALGSHDRVWLCTLTFDQEETDETAYPLVQKWLKAVRAAHGRGGRLRYTCVPERGVRGRFHYHLVVYADDALKWRTLNRWSHGFAHYKMVSGARAARYVMKYILKGHGKVRSSMKLGTQTMEDVHESAFVQVFAAAFPTGEVVSVGGVRVPRELRRAFDQAGRQHVHEDVQDQTCEKVGSTLGVSDPDWIRIMTLQKKYPLPPRGY